jgi:hypothetical protein
VAPFSETTLSAKAVSVKPFLIDPEAEKNPRAGFFSVTTIPGDHARTLLK